MTEQQTITEFVTARLAEDEAAARAATAGPWRYNPSKHYHRPNSPEFEESVFAGPPGADAVSIALTGETDDRQSMADAAHIARHDPARVLREVTAKRAIVEQHTPDLILHSSETPQFCPVCFYSDANVERHPCPTLRHLAAVWSDHPDFDPAWRL